MKNELTISDLKYRPGIRQYLGPISCADCVCSLGGGRANETQDCSVQRIVELAFDIRASLLVRDGSGKAPSDGVQPPPYGQFLSLNSQCPKYEPKVNGKASHSQVVYHAV